MESRISLTSVLVAVSMFAVTVVMHEAATAYSLVSQDLTRQTPESREG